jgi:hypothetical protein
VDNKIARKQRVTKDVTTHMPMRIGMLEPEIKRFCGLFLVLFLDVRAVHTEAANK